MPEENQFSEPGLAQASSAVSGPNSPQAQLTPPLARPQSPSPSTGQPSPFMVKPRKKSWPVLMAGIIIGIILIIAGVLFQVNYQVTDSEGRTIQDIEQGISDLDKEIAEQTQKSDEIFMNEGYTEAFHAASGASVELSLQQEELQDLRDELIAAANSANIFHTGAIWFFVAAACIFIIAITIFLCLHQSSKPKSASIIQG